MSHIKTEFQICDHDFENVIPYGNIDHFCPKCKNFIDPLEWFLMTNFTVVNCTPKKEMRRLEKKLKKSVKEEQNLISKIK